jgi:cell division septation protein DedD
LYDAIEGAPQPLTTRAAPSSEEPLASLAAPTAATPPAAPPAAAAARAPQAGDAARAPLAPAAAPGPHGRFLVQLAALRSHDEAEQEWRQFGVKAPGLARDAHMDIQRADLGAQGIYFRLRAGYFDTRERAGAYCDKAKADGHDCMVVVR